jgi:ABC-2 type transport system permease protein
MDAGPLPAVVTSGSALLRSNAIYPIDVVPDWLKVIAHVNPLTYLVDVLRALMVKGSHSAFGLTVDIGVQLAALVLLMLIASRLYPTVAR